MSGRSSRTMRRNRRWPASESTRAPIARAGGRCDPAQYTAPFDLEERGENARSARIPLSELGLRKGRSLVYLFDFGDEWRLMLKVVETWTDDGDAAYPMLVEAEGVPPPQYTDDEDE